MAFGACQCTMWSLQTSACISTLQMRNAHRAHCYKMLYAFTRAHTHTPTNTCLQSGNTTRIRHGRLTWCPPLSLRSCQITLCGSEGLLRGSAKLPLLGDLLSQLPAPLNTGQAIEGVSFSSLLKLLLQRGHLGRCIGQLLLELSLLRQPCFPGSHVLCVSLTATSKPVWSRPE